MSEQVNYGVLKDYDGNKFIPIGHTGLVYDENGKTVEERLNEIDSKVGFTKIKANSAEIVADSAEDTLEIAATDGLAVLGDAGNDKVTIIHSNSITPGTA